MADGPREEREPRLPERYSLNCTDKDGEEVEPYGPEASEFATSELQGREIGLEFDAERADRYGRLLA